MSTLVWLALCLVEIGQINSFENESFVQNITNWTTPFTLNITENIKYEDNDNNITSIITDDNIFIGTNTTNLNMEKNVTALTADQFYIPKLMDHQIQITNHIKKIFCEIRTIFLYIYVELRVSPEWSNDIIKMLSDCSSGGVIIVRYNASEMKETRDFPFEKDDLSMRLFNVNIMQSPQHVNLSYVKYRFPDKHRSHFVLLFEEYQENDATAFINVFNQFWKREVLNVLFIYWFVNLRIVSYTPFGDNYLIQHTENDISVAKLFPDKVLDMNGHPIRISLFFEETRAIFNISFENDQLDKMAGTDGLLTQLMVRRMNATLVLLQPDDGADIGEFLPDGNTTGSLAQIVNNIVDVSFNTRFLRIAQFRRLVEPTVTNGRDDICILVPKAGFASNVGNLFRSFTIPLWISAILAVPFFIVVYKLFRIGHKGDSIYTLNDVFFNVIAWNFQQSCSKFPERWVIRILIGTWAIYAMLITSSYSGNLTSNLLFHRMLPDINSFKQLDQSNYPLVTYSRYTDLILNFLNQTKFKRLKKSVKAVTQKEFSDLIKKNDVRYAYANKYHINFKLWNTRLMDGKQIFFSMSECPVPYVVIYAMRYGNPYKRRINFILRQAQEAGFIDFWDNKDRKKVSGKVSLHSGGSKALVPLSVLHLQSAFYVFFIGLGLSTVCFMIEIIREYSNARVKLSKELTMTNLVKRK